MRSDEHSRSCLHGGNVERFRHVPHVGALEWTDARRIPEQITIGLRPRAEPRMKLFSDMFNLDDANVGRKRRVETSSHDLDRVVAGHLHAGDLTERVYSCVGPAGPLRADRVPLEACDCLLEKALDGLPTRLPLPANIASSVVAQRDLQRTSHRSRIGTRSDRVPVFSLAIQV